MGIRLREEVDGDLYADSIGATQYETKLNHHKIICVICGAIFFTDTQTYERFCRNLDQGLDNPFQCVGCQEEYDELAFEDH